MKKIFIIIISISTLFPPALVSAKTNWALLEERNTLALEGKCPGREVRVELFSGNGGEPVYTSGAPCLDGNFAFSDNLLQWGSLPDGDYRVVVNGDKKNAKNIAVKRPEVKVATRDIPALETAVPMTPDMKFLGAFVALQQSIVDMREWLSETKYPEFVKAGVGMALDGLDMAVSKVSDLVLSSESAVVSSGNGSASETTVNPVIEETIEPTADAPVADVSTEAVFPAGMEPVISKNQEAPVPLSGTGGTVTAEENIP